MNMAINQKLLMPQHMVERMHELNRQYLLFMRELAESTSGAHVVSNVPSFITDGIATLTTSQIQKMSNCGVLLCDIRLRDKTFWKKLEEGEFNTEAFLHAILEGTKQDVV